MIRRLISALALLGIMLSCALSEALPVQSSYLTCFCGEDVCRCFARAGDEGYLIRAASAALIDAGYLSGKRLYRMSDEMGNAVAEFRFSCGLSAGYELDDETLCLLFSVKPGENIYFVPVNGGKKLHVDYECAGNNPRAVSGGVALYLAANSYTEPCKRCMKNVPIVP